MSSTFTLHPRRASARFPAIAVLAATMVVVALEAGGCRSSSSDTGAPTEPGSARVTRVIDGDTIEVKLGGGTEQVRLLAIDTPETHHPTKPVQCYGKEASAHTTELLPAGTDVRLERDEEERDDYGRLLAYVYRSSDGLFVNLDLVQQGYASLLTIRPNVAHLARPHRRRIARPGPRASACGASAAGRADPPPEAVASRRDLARRTARLRARRPPAHRQLRRPRHVPRRQLRRLREPAHGRGHQRHADGAVPLGP